MSEPRDDDAAASSDPAASEPPVRRYRAMAIGLAAAVVVLVIVDAAAPLWAPPLLRSLGWETAAESPDPALIERLDRLEAAQKQDRQDAAKSEAAAQSAAQVVSTAPQLDRRLAALEARPAGLPAGEIADLRQQLAKLSSTITDLGPRIDAAEKAIAAEKAAPAQSAADPTESALLLTLLQIRAAVEVARPFAAEYDAFTALAQSRPEIAAAAAPLAEPAKTGVASRIVLLTRLYAMAGAIATAAAPPADPDWGDKCWRICAAWSRSAASTAPGRASRRPRSAPPSDCCAAAISPGRSPRSTGSPARLPRPPGRGCRWRVSGSRSRRRCTGSKSC